MKNNSWIRNFLYDPRVRDMDVDDAQLLAIHRQILFEKPIMRHVFEDFYREMSSRCDSYFQVSGQEIELGSGAGFFKKVRPQLVTSDVRQGPHIERVLDAQALDLPDNSVRCVYAINMFHHLPEPGKFFSELIRVLVPGGGCILIEPHHGPVSAAIHSRLHKDERFDPQAQLWNNPEVDGPLSGANQALAYIVFHRDRARFLEQYGKELELLETPVLKNGMRYILSGGVNFRQLIPTAAEPLVKGVEWLLTPISYWTSLHQMIVLKRR